MKVKEQAQVMRLLHKRSRTGLMFVSMVSFKGGIDVACLDLAMLLNLNCCCRCCCWSMASREGLTRARSTSVVESRSVEDQVRFSLMLKQERENLFVP